MAQNITLQGASYSDVPSVVLPKTGGGTASFTDVTDTTASANDVAAGKYFYTAAGVKTEGTSTGGGGTTAGTVTQDANGYLILDDDAPAGPTLITKSITANGTYNASSDSADGYSSVTVNVSGGGGGDMSDPIRFFDYDGTLVASYSSVPASLPTVPTHTGLTSGTWNYTLQQITTQFNAMGTCDVGANYATVSGATEIDIELQEGRLHPYLSLAVNGTVSIDWGDNSTPDTSTGTSLTSRKSDIHHEYSQAGSYTIKITKTSGSGYSLYCTTVYTLLNKNLSTGNTNRVYSNCVQSVRVGADCTIGTSAFSYCYSLASVSIPSTVTSIGTSAFSDCYSLASVSIPSGVTTIGISAFSTCYSLASVSIPSGVTSINGSTFSSCNSLASLTIPSEVTSIAASAFSNCYGMAEYHLLPTTPPTLANVNAFSNIQSDCVIYVPSSKLNDYKTAENWATYASRMVGE